MFFYLLFTECTGIFSPIVCCVTLEKLARSELFTVVEIGTRFLYRILCV